MTVLLKSRREKTSFGIKASLHITHFSRTFQKGFPTICLNMPHHWTSVPKIFKVQKLPAFMQIDSDVVRICQKQNI